MQRSCACIFILNLFSLSVFSSSVGIPFRCKRISKYESPKFRNLRGAHITLVENGERDINSNDNENRSSITLQQNLWLSGNYKSLPKDAGVSEADAMTVTEDNLDTNTHSTTRNDIILEGEKNKEETLADSTFVSEEMYESILLHRNNCNLEIQINEWEDRKLNIRYEDLQNGVSGQCETTLSCKKDNLLAVLVSNIHFSKIDGEKGINLSNEALKVISNKNSFNFTLKQYDGNDKYYPVILTDTDKAFLIFSFGGKASSINNATFNLEVFNYYNGKNKPILQNDFDIYGESGKDVRNIFITTVKPNGY